MFRYMRSLLRFGELLINKKKSQRYGDSMLSSTVFNGPLGMTVHSTLYSTPTVYTIHYGCADFAATQRSDVEMKSRFETT